MAQFVIVYLGGNHPDNPEKQKKHFIEYKKWLASLGNSIMSPMNPLKNTKTVKSDGSVTNSSSTLMSGYTIIQADSIEKALKITKSCPFLKIGGTLEVSELVQM